MMQINFEFKTHRRQNSPIMHGAVLPFSLDTVKPV